MKDGGLVIDAEGPLGDALRARYSGPDLGAVAAFVQFPSEMPIIPLGGNSIEKVRLEFQVEKLLFSFDFMLILEQI